MYKVCVRLKLSVIEGRPGVFFFLSMQLIPCLQSSTSWHDALA